MAHATARGAYQDLAARLNRFPQGAPPSELLYQILARRGSLPDCPSSR
jgi:hypothetical protein